jgi:hypothetical protein
MFREAQNVDLNNFDFDYLVLVILDDEYHLAELWRTTVSEAREIFTWREKHRKYQATQAKAAADVGSVTFSSVWRWSDQRPGVTVLPATDRLRRRPRPRWRDVGLRTAAPTEARRAPRPY